MCCVRRGTWRERFQKRKDWAVMTMCKILAMRKRSWVVSKGTTPYLPSSSTSGGGPGVFCLQRRNTYWRRSGMGPGRTERPQCHDERAYSVWLVDQLLGSSWTLMEHSRCWVSKAEGKRGSTVSWRGFGNKPSWTVVAEARRRQLVLMLRRSKMWLRQWEADNR